MDGRNNLANQEVFRMAQAADPEGNRTVGVITKCDALQAGEEAGVSIDRTPRKKNLLTASLTCRNPPGS